MDQRDTRCGKAPALGGDRAGPTADEDHEIGRLDDGAGLARAAVAADDADRQGVVVDQASLAADGGCDRCAELFGKGFQGGLRTRDHDTAATDEQRPPGRGQQVGGALDGCGVGRHPARREPPERLVGPDLGELDRLLLDVEGQPDMGGARTSRGHLCEGPPKGARQLGAMVDHVVPLGQRPEQRALVEFGQGEASARGGRDVRGDRQDRDRGLVGLDHAREDVGRATAARSLADADPTGDAGIGVGHVGGRALVAGQDVGHAVVEPGQRVVERQAGVAAEAEDMAYAVFLKHPHGRFRAGHGLGHRSPRRQSGDRVSTTKAPESPPGPRLDRG